MKSRIVSFCKEDQHEQQQIDELISIIEEKQILTGKLLKEVQSGRKKERSDEIEQILLCIENFSRDKSYL